MIESPDFSIGKDPKWAIYVNAKKQPGAGHQTKPNCYEKGVVVPTREYLRTRTPTKTA